MKHGKTMDEVLKRGLRSASHDPKEEVDAVSDRVLQRVLSKAPIAEATTEPAQTGVPVSRFPWPRVAMVSAAAAILLAIVIVTLRPQGQEFAVVESADGSKTILQVGQLVRAKSAGTTVVLADGSRIEMKSNSELALERVDDGVRIRLNEGGIIVNAAGQRHGYLHVQTRDVMASVVGTVFLVNADGEGSRVAVIEGEVRIKQGTIEKRLRPGQQVLTESVMQWRPVSEEISWSRSKEMHLALLRQSTARAAAAVEPKATFDVVSIRPTRVQPQTGGRGQSGGGAQARNPRSANQPCSLATEPVINPRRFDAANVTVIQLVAWAHGLPCVRSSPDRGPDFVFGAPAWTQNDGYDVEATRPEGPSDYTTEALGPGRSASIPGPKLQSMIQTMLADRFRLQTHREMRETSVYVLSPLPGGPKFTAELSQPILTDSNGNPIDKPQVVNGVPQRGSRIPNTNTPRPEFSVWQAGDTREWNLTSASEIHLRHKRMEEFVKVLSFIVGRPVLDRTNLTGYYNLFFQFQAVECPTCPFTAPRPGAPREPGTGDGPTDSLFDLLKNVGLELKPSREMLEVLVVDQVERPTEN